MCAVQHYALLGLTPCQTWHFLVIFVAAMLLHPDVQEKAREEIDKVVGRDRLPDVNDRDSLPYIQCVINEVLRYATRCNGITHDSLDLHSGGIQLTRAGFPTG